MKWPAMTLLLASLLVSAPIRAGDAPERAGEAPELRFDPFLRPEASAARSDENRRGAVAFVPQLRSTVVSGKRSMANLGGVVLGLGEEARGYRLVEVHPFEAIFVKDGARVRLEVTRGEAAR